MRRELRREIAQTPRPLRAARPPDTANVHRRDGLLARHRRLLALPALRDPQRRLRTADIANPLKPAHPDEEGRIPLEGRSIFLLALPACCDIAGTTLMNVGLLFVAASIYQMTRGALVLFVGLFSVWFLKRHLGLYKWFSLFVVVFGVAVVGLAGAITRDDKATPNHQALHDTASGSVGAQKEMSQAAYCWRADLHGNAVRA
jgi:drug/metabolite transporter (DMT)-like permease